MMNDHQNERETKIDIWYYFAALLKWRKIIAINFILVTLASALISLILPKWYKATTSILPPKDPDLVSSFGYSTAGSLLRGLPSTFPRLSGLRQGLGTYNYLAILRSRTAMEKVINKFDLLKVYDVQDGSLEKAIKTLEENVSFDIHEEDYISVDVYDKDPNRAAEMANYFVEVLNEISLELNTQESRNNREFIEKRLAAAKIELQRAEDSLRIYQEKTRTIISPVENSANVVAVAELFAVKEKKEVELAIAKKTLSAENPTIEKLQIELNEINNKLKTFPEIGIMSIRLYRNVVIQQKILEHLVPLYEQARINEQKDVPIILVLDKAVPPEKKYKPKRIVIVLTAAGLSLLFSVLFITGKLYNQTLKARNNRSFEDFQDSLKALKTDIKTFMSLKRTGQKVR